jgi:hypothetical protein
LEPFGVFEFASRRRWAFIPSQSSLRWRSHIPVPSTTARPGIGTATHIAGAHFALRTDTQLVHVPYTVAWTIIADLLGGRIHATFAPEAFTLPLLQDGRLLALAVADEEPICEPIATACRTAGSVPPR